MENNFIEVTETSGTLVSSEQVRRMSNRYCWALPYCEDKDVVEVACGSGQGVGLISDVARSYIGGDVSKELLSIAIDHFGESYNLMQFDAMKLPFEDESKDVIVCFEAIYYFPSFMTFLNEVNRVLRKGGYLLLSTANKDLEDFNPSPFTYSYYGVSELNEILSDNNFTCTFYGDMKVRNKSFLSRLLKHLKILAVKLDLMPKTMTGKRLLKRIVFGKLVHLEADLRNVVHHENTITGIDAVIPDSIHKVILVSAKKV